MKTQAKNFIAAALLCMLLACLALLGVGRTPSRAEEGDGAKLVLPPSYEEYLPLQAPADAAFSEEHIAVADGGTLYVYDRAEKTYASVSLSAGNTVAKLGFAGERLFVATTGVSNSFYEYSFTEKQLKSFSFNCSTFLVEGDALYTATVSNAKTTIASYKISALQNGTSAQAETLGTLDTNATPSLAYSGNLYCIVDGQVYYPDSTGKFGSGSFYLSSEDPALVNGVKSVCAYGGRLLYTAQGGLYASDLSTHTSRLLLAGEGFGALASYGETLYAVCGTSVRAISVSGDTAAFTGYEIASASSSVNRLRGAVDTARAGDLLVTADAGNGRISVAVLDNEKEGYIIRTCSVFPCLDENQSPYVPTHIATDGSIIAVSSADAHIYLYHFGDESYYYCHDLAGDPAIDLACVHGTCYFITQTSYGKAEDGFLTFERTENLSKELFTDNRGYLYVVNTNGKVLVYSESEFIEPNAIVSREIDFTISDTFSSVQSDEKGNIYYIRQNALWKNETKLIDLSDSPFVYGESIEQPVSFALCHEDGKVFLLYQNYIVIKTMLDF